ncbi:MAG TPA: hypothetical protein VFX16_29220 [Pseudonocardiaceae bacterium]|nr:hypothetical protein [Pseudonocardiaceae bacterium]
MSNIAVRDVVRVVVGEIAPEELPLVDGLAQFGDATAVRRLSRQGGRREPLGFGFDEATALVTPVVWLAVDQAARRLGGAAADGAVTGAKSVLGRIRGRTTPVVVPALSSDQLAVVHREILRVAADRGLGEKRALMIADAVVARLTLGANDPAGPADGVPPART